MLSFFPKLINSGLSYFGGSLSSILSEYDLNKFVHLFLKVSKKYLDCFSSLPHCITFSNKFQNCVALY